MEDIAIEMITAIAPSTVIVAMERFLTDGDRTFDVSEEKVSGKAL